MLSPEKPMLSGCILLRKINAIKMNNICKKPFSGKLCKKKKIPAAAMFQQRILKGLVYLGFQQGRVHTIQKTCGHTCRKYGIIFTMSNLRFCFLFYDTIFNDFRKKMLLLHKREVYWLDQRLPGYTYENRKFAMRILCKGSFQI